MRYVIGILISVGLVILIIVLLVSGGGKPSVKPFDLMSLADTAGTVKLTEQGQLTADSERRSIEITVGRDSNDLQIIQGYQGKVISDHAIGNNQAAYEAFLRGLSLADYTDGDNNPAHKDERGYCPLGQRYIYEVISPDGKTEMRYWSSSCGIGTLKGNASLIQTLFQNQIPGYGDLTSDVNL